MTVSDALFDALNAGLVVLDRDRRIVRWNTWMASASGFVAASASGKTLDELFPESALTRLQTASSAALESGVSSLLTHALHPRLFPLKTRSGLELLHDVTVSAISRGTSATCLIHVADVTLAVRRERYLRDRQNARYDAVVESAPDVILTLDGAGVIRFANPAAVEQFGYSGDELVNSSAKMLFEADDGWERLWAAASGGERLRSATELLARRKDGSHTHVEVSASRWQEASHAFVTVILRDITARRAIEAALRSSEQKALATADALADLNATLEQRVQERTTQLLKVEEALRQSHKMEAIGQLTGGIAHDFNNLLQGILGSLNIMQRRLREGRISDLDRFIQVAVSSADRAAVLTHRLLAFSRRQPVDPRPVNLNELIASMEELLRRSVGATVKMHMQFSDDLSLVRCDANQMENALLNLAINARDAMPDGGVMTVHTANREIGPDEAALRELEAGSYVSVSVQDTGVGMDVEVKARAFDPFFTTKPIGKGTGLGLSMIYGFVRQSNGSVQITSAPGTGTTIDICLPRFDGRMTEPDAGAEASAVSRSLSNDVVLVVEDEDVVRLLVGEVLKELGYQPLEVSDGASALRILQSSQRVDLLITDIGLPDINGRQIADAGRLKRPRLKVLFMTGYAEGAASSGFLDEGMELIGKPFTIERLAAKIREMLVAP